MARPKRIYISNLKTVPLLCLLAFLFQTNKAQVMEPLDWSEKIQLYGHGYSAPNDFTDEELQYIADNYAIFTVEKRSGYLDYGGNPSTEAATIGTAAKLKALNPDIKVLLYWNSVMNYENLFESNAEFGEHPEWVHSIWTVGSGTQYEIYDLENIDCQDWWVNSVVDIIERGNLDGVFFDAGPKAEVAGLTAALSTAKGRVRDSIGDDKIIIYNGYRVSNENTIQAGPDFIENSSGVFIEFFLHSPLDTKEEAVLLFDHLINAFKDGKMIVPRGTPSSVLPNTEDPFLFTFASFLLFYGPNSYYIYNEAYDKTKGMFDYYSEYYNISTGQSLGNPQRNGWVYTREFENISVRVDLENRKAAITEKSQLSFKLTDETTAEYLPDVTLEIDGLSYTTDSLGEISVVLEGGQYNFRISKAGYDTLNQSINISKDTILALQMQTLINNIQQQLREQVKVYPIPSSEYLHIESQLNLNKIIIYNQSGRLIESKEHNGLTYKLTTSDYPDGMYLLQLEMENEQTTLIKFSVAKK